MEEIGMIKIAICEDDIEVIKKIKTIAEDLFTKKDIPILIECFYDDGELLKKQKSIKI